MGLIEDIISYELIKKLDRVGIGALKKKQIYVENISIDETVKFFYYLAKENNWPALFDQEIEPGQKRVVLFQVGQWGFSLKGTQWLSALIYFKDGKTVLDVASKSKMAQLIDWGANKKNIQLVEDFVNKVLADSSLRSKINNWQVEKVAKRPVVNRKWLILFFFGIPVIVLVIFLIFNISHIRDYLPWFQESYTMIDIECEEMTDEVKNELKTLDWKKTRLDNSKYPSSLQPGKMWIANTLSKKNISTVNKINKDCSMWFEINCVSVQYGVTYKNMAYKCPYVVFAEDEESQKVKEEYLLKTEEENKVTIKNVTKLPSEMPTILILTLSDGEKSKKATIIFDDKNYYIWNYSLSNDRKKIAINYTKKEWEDFNILVFDAETEQQSVILTMNTGMGSNPNDFDDGQPRSLTPLFWSTDNQKIYLRGNWTDGWGDLWVVNMDGSNLEHLDKNSIHIQEGYIINEASTKVVYLNGPGLCDWSGRVNLLDTTTNNVDIIFEDHKYSTSLYEWLDNDKFVYGLAEHESGEGCFAKFSPVQKYVFDVKTGQYEEYKLK